MVVRVLPRVPRPALQAGAALVMLLAALLHLLGCSHGPAPSATPRTDTPLATVATALEAPVPPRHPNVVAAGPAEDRQPPCPGGDEPTVQQARDSVTPAAPAVELLIGSTHDGPGSPKANGPIPHCHSGGRTAPTQACLSVWRT